MTLADSFSPTYRTAHEAGIRRLLAYQGEHLRGEMSRGRQVALMMARDAEVDAEVDAITSLWMWREAVVEAFPEAHFAMSFREPESWSRSLALQFIRFSTSSDESLRADFALVALRLWMSVDSEAQADDVGQDFAALASDYWLRAATEQLLFPPERSTYIDMHQMEHGLVRLEQQLGLASGTVNVAAHSHIRPADQQIPAVLDVALRDAFGSEHYALLEQLQARAQE